MTRSAQKKDMIGALVSLATFVIAYFLCREIKAEAAIWPNMICAVGSVLSVVQLLDAALKYKKLPEEAPLTEEQKKAAREKNLHAIEVVIIVALWIFLLDKVGFIVVSSVGTLALMCVTYRPQSKKEWTLYVGVSVVLSVVLWFGFGTLLGARLPSGLLI